MLQNQCEAQEDILSSENQSSLSGSSFSLASSAPLLKHSHVFESTITLPKISAFLTDQEIRSKGDDEEDEDKFTSVADFLPHCPELKLIPDGATEPLSLNGLNSKSSKSKDVVISCVLQGGKEEKEYTPGEKLAPATTKTFSSVSVKREDQSDTSLVISGDQEGHEHHQQRETLGFGIQKFSSTPSHPPRIW
ncbi:hypothetical protein XENOCAPTIV_026030 [Xenoophorus captivus]|uniref:Uncharacterized protein n=1 Tax=Xenoophorus captivus TaxID=1517983 RepID=A0ABV0S3T5_9TELE